MSRRPDVVAVRPATRLDTRLDARPSTRRAARTTWSRTAVIFAGCLGLMALLTRVDTTAQSRVAEGWQQKLGPIAELTVRIDDGDKKPCKGTGFIVGYGEDKVYVVTAQRVVSSIVQTDPAVLGVQFRTRGAAAGARRSAVPRRLAGKVLHEDQAADLAVVEVTDAALAASVKGLKFDVLGDSAHLVPRDQVLLTGCEGSAVAEAAPRLGPVLRPTRDTSPDKLYVQRHKTNAEYSGGPMAHVLGQTLTLVGLTLNAQARAEGVMMHAVLRQLEAWKVPVALRAPYTDVGCSYTVTPTQTRLVGMRVEEGLMLVGAPQKYRSSIEVKTTPQCTWRVEVDGVPWVGVYDAAGKRIVAGQAHKGTATLYLAPTKSNVVDGAFARSSGLRVAGRLFRLMQDSTNL